MALLLRKNFEKRKTSLRSIIAAAFVFAMFIASSHAEAAGISPIRLQVPVEKGGISREYNFYISRADASKEERFTLTANQPFVDLLNQDIFVMPIGETIVPLPFRINASELDFGTYRANIRLVPITEINEPGLSFIVAVTGDIVAEVVEEVPEVIVVPPPPVNPFQLRDLVLKKDASVEGHIEATFSVANTGTETLQNGTYTVVVKKQGLDLLTYRGYFEQMEPGTVIDLVQHLLILDPGMYEVVVFAETQNDLKTETRTLSFSIAENTAVKDMFVLWLGLGVLVIIVGLILLIKKPTRL